MDNQTILEKAFEKHNCQNIISPDGRVYTAILEAMSIAGQGYKAGELYITIGGPVEQKTSNPFTTIVDEGKNPVDREFLISMFALAISKEDFVKKVNLGITNKKSYVSDYNNLLINDWYDEFYYNAEPVSPKRHYFKGDKTLKALALDFVEEIGPSTSTEIRRFMFELANTGQTYDPIKNRGWYSSYFSDASSWIKYLPKARFSQPSKDDNRILRRKADGKYVVICED